LAIALMTLVGVPLGFIGLIVFLIVDLTYKRKVPDVTKHPQEFELWTQSVILSKLSKSPTQSSSQHPKGCVGKTAGLKRAPSPKLKSGNVERGGKVMPPSSQRSQVAPRGRWAALKTETKGCSESSLGGRNDC
jgi:hypothetical protein